MTDTIAVAGLKKCFAEVEAVSEISFSVSQGELFGFLGPNGAGKTTTINMLTGPRREIINDVLGGRPIAATW